ncbi:hypothetical protein B7Y94_00080 [Candidatus Saccharibacteria bacterium 32-49-12]|nr:MAG: hypothetical protein B7Y94_00080 [Candidatus Saccharibacteria bacterium 32-49-12]
MENYSKPQSAGRRKSIKGWYWLIVLPVWTYVAFLLAQLAVVAGQMLMMALGVSLDAVNQTLYVTTLSALIYILAVVIVTGLPYLFWRRKTTRRELGAHAWPAWMDILLTVPTYVVYMIVTALLLSVVVKLLPGIDLEQSQQLPFSQTMLASQWHYLLAFLTLVVFAPVAEEILFRGYLYGKLRRSAPVWLAIIITSVTFGAAHLWGGAGQPLQWAVFFDTMALSVVLCVLREQTGAIWASVLVHALKNGIAFYLLFVNPQLIEQIQAAILPLL